LVADGSPGRPKAGVLVKGLLIHLEGNVDKPATPGQVVGVYKSITVVSWLRYIETNKLHAPGRFWQNYYYDRIIRNNEELEHTRQYIRNNPTKQNNKQ
jgi:hypothetical protein